MDEIIEPIDEVMNNLNIAVVPSVMDVMRAFGSVVLPCVDTGFVTG
jgi:hypothetical protein